MLSAFELERQARIEENKRRMSEMGINTLATKLDAVAAPIPNPQVRASLTTRIVPFSRLFPRPAKGDRPRGSRDARARLPSVPRVMRLGVDPDRVARRSNKLVRKPPGSRWRLLRSQTALTTDYTIEKRK